MSLKNKITLKTECMNNTLKQQIIKMICKKYIKIYFLKNNDLLIYLYIYNSRERIFFVCLVERNFCSNIIIMMTTTTTLNKIPISKWSYGMMIHIQIYFSINNLWGDG